MPSLSAMAKEAKKKSKSAPPKKPAPRAGIFKSSERIADSDLDSDTESDSDSDSDSEPPKLAAKPILVVKGINGHKKIAPTKPDSDSDEDDESESSDEDSSGSGSSSGEEEESEGEEEVMPEKVATKTGSPERPSNPAPTVSIRSQPVAPYIAPSGFQLVQSDRDTNKTASQIFSNQNLAGRQVWYITAPASVPISAIKKVSLQDVQLGKSSVSLNGQEYGFVQAEENDKEHARVMIPDGGSNTYHMAKRFIDQTLHLQQIVQLPSSLDGSSSQSTSSQHQSRATVPAKKPVRQQPEGLKMRFLPIGSASMEVVTTLRRTNMDPDLEMKDAPAMFKQPPKLTQIEAENSSSSSGGESSSEDEEMEDSKKTTLKSATQIDASPTESSDVSSESNDESSDDSEEDVPAMPLPSKNLSTSQQPSLKRKLSDLNDSNPLRSLSQSPLLNGTQLKKVKLNQPVSSAPAPALSTSNKRNSAPQSTMPPPKSTIIPPPSSSRVRSTESPVSWPVRQSPIPPPRSIIPPLRLSAHSSTAGSSLNRSGSESSQLRLLAESTDLAPKGKKVISSQHKNQQPDPSLTEEQRRKEIKQQKKKDKSDQRRLVDNVASHLAKGSSDAQSSAESLQPSSVLRPHPMQNPYKTSPHDSASNLKGDQIQPPASKSKAKKFKVPKDSVITKENGHIPHVQSSITPIPPPKRTSSILPPKLKVSGLK